MQIQDLEQTPSEAWCKRCHQPLKGLPQSGHQCPECGLEFDLRDPHTFSARPPSKVRRRLVAVITLAVIGTMTWILWPDGRTVATVSITTQQGNVVYQRWRFDAPSWNPVRLLGWTSNTGALDQVEWELYEHKVVSSITGSTRNWLGSATFRPGFPPRVLGQIVNDESAADILDRMIRDE